MDKTIEQQVRDLAAREEIKELTARYCLHVVRGEGEAVVQLFTEDGVFDGTNAGINVARGRQALLEFYKAVREPEQAIPFIHNHIIEVDGDLASGTCALEGRFVRKGESYTGAGMYEDKYRKENGKWRFAERKLRFYHMVPLKTGWAEAARETKSKS